MHTSFKDKASHAAAVSLYTTLLDNAREVGQAWEDHWAQAGLPVPRTAKDMMARLNELQTKFKVDDPIPLFLLDASIDIWKQRLRVDDPFDGSSSFGFSSCPLCLMYASSDCAVKCAGCPISSTTGTTGCTKTPYGAAVGAFYSWQIACLDYKISEAYDLDDKDEDFKKVDAARLVWLDHATKMIELMEYIVADLQKKGSPR